MFLQKCLNENEVPKSLRLERRVHTIRGDGHGDTAATIEEILKNAELGILETLISHYDGLIDATTWELQSIKTDLQARSGREQEEEVSSIQRAEQSEDDLRSSLERTRNEKLRKLKRPNTPSSTPRSTDGGPHTVDPDGTRDCM